MTDTFGAAAAAAHLAHRAIVIALESYNAPKEMKLMADQMKTSILALDQAKKLVDELFPDKSEYDRLLIKNREEQVSDGGRDMGLQDLVTMIDENVKKYHEYATSLEKSLMKERMIVDRLKWHWTAKAIRADLALMKQFEDSFVLIVTTLQSRTLNDLKSENAAILSVVSGLRSSVWSYEGRRIFDDCINWLPVSSIDVEQKLSEERDKTRDSKPKWVLQDDSFVRWIETTGLENRWLWLFGEPGAGKTCIASYITDHLRKPRLFDEPNIASITRSLTGSTIKDQSPLSSPHTPESTAFEDGVGGLPTDTTLASDTGVAVFFCSYKVKDQQDSDTILKVVIRQLLLQLQNSEPSKAYQRIGLIDDLRTQKSPGGRSGLKTILEKIISDFRQTTIIVDALDENAFGFEELLHSLNLLRSQNLKILVTSRDGNDGSLRRLARDYKALQFTANPNDEAIVEYARARLRRIAARDDSEPVSGPILPEVLEDAEERGRIIEIVRESSQGNYFCAELQITALKGCEDSEELQNALKFPAAGLEQMVEKAINSVKNQPKARNREAGMKALMWAVYARTTLTVAELQQVLALDIYQDPEEKVKFSKKFLIESTRYFLSLDESATAIQVHKSIRDYCDKEGHHFFDDAHFEMGRICLEYLSLGEFRTHCSSDEEWNTRTKKHPFLKYSSRNWGFHVKKAKESRFLEAGGSPSLMKFLKIERNANLIAFGLQSALNEYGLWGPNEWESLEERGQAKIWIPHALAYFDLDNTAEEWLSIGGNKPDPHDKKYYSALFMACYIGGDKKCNIISTLLDNGADPAREAPNGQHPLNVAASRNHKDIVKILVDERADLVRQTNLHGGAPLSDAAASGGVASVRAIIDALESLDDCETLIAHKDKNENSALHHAARANNDKAIQLILNSKGGGKMLNEHTKIWQDTPLHVAASKGNPDALRALLKFNPDTSARQKEGKTPLHLATQKPFPETGACAQILLDCSDLSLQDNKGRNIWHFAMENGRPRHVQQMLDRRVPLELLQVRDKRGLTPVSAALKEKSGWWLECVLKILREYTEYILPEEAKAIWSLLLHRKDLLKLEILYEHLQSRLPSVDNGETTMLHRAVETASIVLVRNTLQNDGNIDVNYIDSNGSAPLHIAVAKRYEEVAKYLIESANADITLPDKKGRTPLHLAVESDMPTIADILLEKKVSLTATDKDNVTPLDRASKHNGVRKLWRTRAIEARFSSTATQEIECLSHSTTDSLVVCGDEDTMKALAFRDIPKSKIFLHGHEYTRSEPLPGNVKVPVSRLSVSIWARDQGWADHAKDHPQDKGGWKQSHTWFDLAIIRDGKRMPSIEFSRNRLALGETSEYRGVWDIDGGSVGDDSTSRPRGPQDQEKVRSFLRELNPGDRIAIIAKSDPWKLWMNVVEKASIKLWYED